MSNYHLRKGKVVHNYKKEYGMTLKEAKELCKKVNGRLPRIGYEMKFDEKIYPQWVTYPSGTKHYQYTKQKFILRNNAGSYVLDCYFGEATTAEYIEYSNSKTS